MGEVRGKSSTVMVKDPKKIARPNPIGPKFNDVDALHSTGPGPVCAVLGISYDQLKKLLRDGVLPQTKRVGQWDLIAANRAYLTWKIRGGERDESTFAVRHKRELEELRMAKTKADAAEGEVLYKEDVKLAIDAAMTVIATQLDGLGGRLCMELAAMTDPAVIRKRVLDEARKIRTAATSKLRHLADHS